MAYYEQALAIARAVGNRAGEGTALNNLGGVFYALGQDAQAIQYLEQALVLLRELGTRADEATAAGNLMVVWKRQQHRRRFSMASRPLTGSRPSGGTSRS